MNYDHISGALLWYAITVGVTCAGCLLASVTGGMRIARSDWGVFGAALLLFPACALLLTGFLNEAYCNHLPWLSDPGFLCSHPSSQQ